MGSSLLRHAGHRADPRSIGTQPPEPVGPLVALHHYVTRAVRFSGRASRSELWWMVAWGLGVSLVGRAWMDTFGGGSFAPVMQQEFAQLNHLGQVGFGIWGFVSLALLVPTLALVVRRLHDVNFSGAWVILGIVPMLGVVFLLVCALMPSVPQARFDAPEG